MNGPCGTFRHTLRVPTWLQHLTSAQKTTPCSTHELLAWDQSLRIVLTSSRPVQRTEFARASSSRRWWLPIRPIGASQGVQPTAINTVARMGAHQGKKAQDKALCPRQNEHCCQCPSTGRSACIRARWSPAWIALAWTDVQRCRKSRYMKR